MNKEQMNKMFAAEMKRSSAPPSNVPEPQQQQPVALPPIALMMGEIQMQAEGLNVGLTPDGKKVLQFVQGPLTVTILINRDEIKQAIIKGLTGVELAR